MATRAWIGSFACTLVAASCGGRLAADGDDGRDAAARGSALLFRDDGDGGSPELSCTPCPAPDVCGGCVARVGGGGFCVPFCNKDGFCTSDRNCQWVADPDGSFFPACLPSNGACGEPLRVLEGGASP